MKDVLLSKCERDFIVKAITEETRLDGRHMHDYRKLKISFGMERGSCLVFLGQTKVFAQVSCAVVAPKPSRPHEGLMFINVELSPMAAPNFEVGRLSEYGIEITRLLERCIIDARAVDQESLCISVGQKAWSVRVDVHVLNHDGNILDCTSIAAIAALSHFRRPHVSVTGEEVTIHSFEDRHGVPITMHHMPICTTFAYFNDGRVMVVDPTEREELVMDGKIVVGMNIYQEICLLHAGGTASLDKDEILRCTKISLLKAKETIEMIKTSLVEDEEKRSRREAISFVQLIHEELINTSKRSTLGLTMQNSDTTRDVLTVQVDDSDNSDHEQNMKDIEVEVVRIQGVGTASVNVQPAFAVKDNDSVIKIAKQSNKKTKAKKSRKPRKMDVDGDSEEETIVTLDNLDCV